jgi:putative FmdB family regulatory protein
MEGFWTSGYPMPIYAYRCSACGHAKDVLQKLSDPVLTVCPACGQASFSKQLTAAGFQLKGSGWYVTDFRDGGSAKAGAKAGADAGAKAGDAADKSSGDKSAADKAGSVDKPAGSEAGKPASAASSGGESKPAASAPPASS